MSMATAALCREEANISSSVADAKFTSPLSNAEDEIRRILRNLEALIIDYNYLKDADDTFSEDGGDTYRLTYEHIKTLSDGYDSATTETYVALLAAINVSLAYNSQDALTDDNKYQLRQAGRDFRKAEVLLALSQFAIIGNLRPTNEGGFITEINYQSGKASIMSQDQALKLSKKFRHEAFKQLFPHLKDPESDTIKDSIEYENGTGAEVTVPNSFTHPDINISAVPTKKLYKSKNPRERYADQG